MERSSVFWKLTAALALLCVALMLGGCGRKGDPVPDHSRDAFAFADLRAVAAADGVVTFSGSVTGASQNLEYMVLEMEAVDGELCEGCPFLAQEQQRVDSRDAWESDSGSAFSFVYRPVFPGRAYRWRLVGHNLYSGLSDVTSPMQTVFMDPLAPVSMPVDGE